MLKASDDDEERISIRVNTRIAHMMVMVALSCFTNTGTCSLLLDLTDVWIAHINACSIVQYDTIIYVASRHRDIRRHHARMMHHHHACCSTHFIHVLCQFFTTYSKLVTHVNVRIGFRWCYHNMLRSGKY